MAEASASANGSFTTNGTTLTMNTDCSSDRSRGPQSLPYSAFMTSAGALMLELWQGSSGSGASVVIFYRRL
jgi:hypothetical protein